MGRRLFNAAAAVSAIFCLASGALWVRSLRHFECVDVRYARCPQGDELHSFYVGCSWYSNTHRLDLSRRVFTPRHCQGRREDWMKSLRSSYPPGLRLEFLGENVTMFMNGYPPGFSARYYPSRQTDFFGGSCTLAVRPWLPTLLTAILPAIWLYRFLRTASWQFGLQQLLVAISLIAAALGAGIWLK